MRKQNKVIFRKMLFYCIPLMTILYGCNPSPDIKKEAETTSTIRPIPYMWIPKEKAEERALWFRFGKLDGVTESKRELLNDYLESNSHALGYSYSCQSFDNLLSIMEKAYPNIASLRVYFGENDQEDEPDGVPMDQKKIPNSQIVLIFAPTDANDNDLGTYYIFGSDGHPYLFTKKGNSKLMGNWIDNYKSDESESQDVLAVTVDQNDTVNIDKATGNITDTRSILYCYEDFKDYIQKERDYQNSIIKAELGSSANLIDSIEIDFASFPDTGIGPNHPQNVSSTSFKNRLHVLFGFTIKGVPYYIDDSPDFYTRHSKVGQAYSNCNPSSPNKSLYRWPLGGGGGSADNGQLCPPKCNN